LVAGGTGGLSAPADLIFASNGNLLVASGNGEVLSYDGDTGGFLGALVPAGSGGLSMPIRLLIVPEPGSLTLSLVALFIAGAAGGISLLRSHRFRHNEAEGGRRPPWD